jgi:hypothetical protein
MVSSYTLAYVLLSISLFQVLCLSIVLSGKALSASPKSVWVPAYVGLTTASTFLYYFILT